MHSIFQNVPAGYSCAGKIPGTPTASTLARVFLIFAMGIVIGGCSTYEDDARKMMTAWRVADYQTAADLAASAADDASETDRLLWQLEWGAAERAAGKFTKSVQAFDAAAESFSHWDQKADVSLSREVLSTVTNMSAFPYRGTAYDRIMLNTYQALNYLSLGQSDKARVALNAALDAQAGAVKANAARIEKAEAAAKDAANSTNTSQGYDANRAMQDGKFNAALSQNYAEMRRLSAYADYVNPFSVWLHGVFFMATATDNSDIERAHKSLERAAQMVPNCAAAQADWDTINKMRHGDAAVPAITYVIFETGLAPARRETRIDIPVFIFSDTVPYVGAAFPKLQFNDTYTNTLVVSTAASGAVSTQTVASMDSVIAKDFDNELPAIITRTLITSGLKATAMYFINHAARKNYERHGENFASALVYVGSVFTTGVYSAATTRADLRTWLTLPKEFQVARLATPADRKLRLLAGQSPAVDVTVIPGTINVVYVKTTGVNTALRISQFALRAEHAPSIAGAVASPPNSSSQHSEKP